MASKKITDMSLKPAMVDADLFTIVDSETGVLAEQNKAVLRSVALDGYVLEASLGEAALLDVGTTSGTVAAGNAPVAAAAAEVADHESTFAHADLPTASQKAALNAAPTLSGVNPVATVADLPVDELTADELAAINGANAPDAGNVFATMDDLPAAAPVDSVNGQTGVVVLDADDIDDAATTNKFATAAELASITSALQPTDLSTTGNITPKTGDLDLNSLGGGSDLTADELAAIEGAASPSAANVFATMNDVSAAGGGTVTSVAVTGSDGIEVDSGSPVTTAGIIALGINAATLRSTINVEDGASADQTAQEIANAIDADATAEATLKSALGVVTAPPSDGNYYAYKDGAWVNITNKIINP